MQGFAARRVDNGVVSVTIVPDLGAKLSSLRDLRSGREWLWVSDRLPFARHDSGAPYVEVADSGGWDECFPTVAPCGRVAGWDRSLPDHGEVWSRAWDVSVDIAADASAATVAASVTIDGSYTFGRTIAMRAGSARLDFSYRVEDLTGRDRPFIWSSHPLFAIEPGMGIELPEGCGVEVWSEAGGTAFAGAGTRAWPVRARVGEEEHLLTHVPPRGAGLAGKLWTRPLANGATAALHADDGSIRFLLGERLAQVGVWVNASGWTGIGGEPYFNLALEPCIGAQDSLLVAVAEEQCFAELPANGQVTWDMAVLLEAAVLELGRDDQG